MTQPQPQPLFDPAALVRELSALPATARLDDDAIRHVSRLAYSQLNQGHVEEAYRYYGLLTLYRPTQTEFLAGQGLCARRLGRLAEAGALFDLAAMIEPENPVHTLLAAECLLESGALDEARLALLQIKRLCAASGGHPDIAERAAALLELVDNAAARAA